MRRRAQLLEEVALTVWLAGPLAQFSGWVELLADDPAAAERELRWGYDRLGEIGELGWLSTVAGLLGEALCAQGRYDEAEELTSVTEESADAEDAYSQALWRSVRAKVLTRRGELSGAEQLARESVELAETTDFLHLRWHVHRSAGEVFFRAGNLRDASVVLNAAVALANQKGSTVGVRRASDLLEQVRIASLHDSNDRSP